MGSWTPLIPPRAPQFVPALLQLIHGPGAGFAASCPALAFALSPGFCSDTRTVLPTPKPVPRLRWPHDCHSFPDKARNDGVEILELPGSHGGAGADLPRGQMSPHTAFLLQLQTRSCSFASHFPGPVSSPSRAVRASGSPSPPWDRWGNNSLSLNTGGCNSEAVCRCVQSELPAVAAVAQPRGCSACHQHRFALLFPSSSLLG